MLGAADCLLKVVIHVDAARSQEALATILAASQSYELWIQKNCNSHRTSHHHAVLRAELLVFSLNCRLAWKLDQGMPVCCISSISNKKVLLWCVYVEVVTLNYLIGRTLRREKTYCKAVFKKCIWFLQKEQNWQNKGHI